MAWRRQQEELSQSKKKKEKKIVQREKKATKKDHFSGFIEEDADGDQWLVWSAKIFFLFQPEVLMSCSVDDILTIFRETLGDGGKAYLKTKLR